MSTFNFTNLNNLQAFIGTDNIYLTNVNSMTGSQYTTLYFNNCALTETAENYLFENIIYAGWPSTGVLHIEDGTNAASNTWNSTTLANYMSASNNWDIYTN
jgi:hypothetical protein